MNAVVERVLDWIWPRLTGPRGRLQSVPAQLFPPTADEAATDAITTMLSEIESSEEERKKAADQKLQAVLQFAAIAVTISLGVATFLSDPARRDLDKRLLTGIVLLTAYVAVQCLCAVLNAVAGLERRSFRRVTLSELRWDGDQDINRYKHRIAKVRAECLSENAEVINIKVSYMAVSHRAVRNALAGLVIAVLVVVAITIAKTSRMGSPTKSSPSVTGHGSEPAFRLPQSR